MKAENYVKNNNGFVVSETNLRANVPAEEILDSLRERRITGQLTFFFIDGGVRSVMLTERKRTTDADADKIREILSRV